MCASSSFVGVCLRRIEEEEDDEEEEEEEEEEEQEEFRAKSSLNHQKNQWKRLPMTFQHNRRVFGSQKKGKKPTHSLSKKKEPDDIRLHERTCSESETKKETR